MATPLPPVRLETSGDVLSTVDMVVQRRDGLRWLRELDDDDDDDNDDDDRIVLAKSAYRALDLAGRCKTAG